VFRDGVFKLQVEFVLEEALADEIDGGVLRKNDDEVVSHPGVAAAPYQRAQCIALVDAFGLNQRVLEGGFVDGVVVPVTRLGVVLDKLVKNGAFAESTGPVSNAIETAELMGCGWADFGLRASWDECRCGICSSNRMGYGRSAGRQRRLGSSNGVAAGV